MRKINFNWIYLVASVLALISAFVAFFNSDFMNAKLDLILCILFTNLHREGVRVTMSVETKDLLRVINSNEFRKN